MKKIPHDPNRICTNNTTLMVTGSRISVVLHRTLIVDCDADTITLDLGGYNTATTRARMNQTAGQFRLPFKVYNKGGQAFARSSLDGEARPFSGGPVVLPRRVKVEA